MPSAYHQYPRTPVLNNILIWVGGGLCVLSIAGIRFFALMMTFFGPVVITSAAAVLILGIWRKNRPLLIVQLDQLVIMPRMFGQRYIDLQPVVELERTGNLLLFHTKMANKLPLDLNYLHANQREDAFEKIAERINALRQAELDAGEPKRSYLDPENEGPPLSLIHI